MPSGAAPAAKAGWPWEACYSGPATVLKAADCGCICHADCQHSRHRHSTASAMGHRLRIMAVSVVLTASALAALQAAHRGCVCHPSCQHPRRHASSPAQGHPLAAQGAHPLPGRTPSTPPGSPQMGIRVAAVGVCANCPAAILHRPHMQAGAHAMCQVTGLASCQPLCCCRLADLGACAAGAI